MLQRVRACSSALLAIGMVLAVPLLTGAVVPPVSSDAHAPATHPASPWTTIPPECWVFPDIGLPLPDSNRCRGEIAVRGAVDPPSARPGDRVRQTAHVSNVGDVPLIGIHVELDAGPCVRGRAWLPPGEDAVFSCSGTFPDTGRATVRAQAHGPDGVPVSASDSSEAPPPPPPPEPPPPSPQPRVELMLGEPEPAAGAFDLPVTVRNPSAVPLSDVRVTGQPASCRRVVGDMAPGGSATYRCRVAPGSAVALAVTARSAVGDTSAEAGFTVPPARPEVEPPPPPPVAEQPPVGERELAEAGGPLDSPQRTAGFIAILGALVMMVSVGALSSATRSK